MPATRPPVVDDRAAWPRPPASATPAGRTAAPSRVDEVAVRPDLPDEDGLAFVDRHRERARELDLDPRRRDGRHRLEGGDQRPGRQPEQVLAAGAGERGLDRVLVGVGQAGELELRVVERGRGTDPVDRRRRHEHRERRARAHDGQSGRRPAHRPRPATPGIGVRLRLDCDRPAAHRGRSAVVRRRPARAAWRSRARSTIRTQTSANV